MPYADGIGPTPWGRLCLSTGRQRRRHQSSPALERRALHPVVERRYCLWRWAGRPIPLSPLQWTLGLNSGRAHAAQDCLANPRWARPIASADKHRGQIAQLPAIFAGGMYEPKSSSINSPVIDKRGGSDGQKCHRGMGDIHRRDAKCGRRDRSVPPMSRGTCRRAGPEPPAGESATST